MSFLQPKSITKTLIHYLSSLNIYVPPPSIHTLKHSYQCVSTMNFDLENVILMKGILGPGMIQSVKFLPVVKT